MLPWYATREAVKRALDSKETARNDDQADRAVAAASRAVDGDLHRRFYPEVQTRSFEAPRGRVLFPGDLVAVDSITASGVTVASADFDLLPVTGPPFTRIEFDGSFSYGSDRRPIEVTGTWGYDDRTETAGELAAAIADAAGTTVDVSDGSVLGVGDLLNVESERLVVAARSMLATGQTLQDGMGEQVNDRTLTVADGTQIHAGEVLLVDAERMLVTEVSGNDVLVRRAWDGSVSASHISGASVSALRRLTVERGVLGTTAATHTQGTAVTRQVYPGSVVAYTVALAEHLLLKETTGQGGEVGGRGVTTTLDMVATDARRGYRRMLLG